jgi:hypothetical protein
MIVHCFADYADTQNNLGAFVRMKVQEFANWSARLTGLPDERLQPSGKELLCKSVAADYFQIRAQWAVEGGNEDGSISDPTQYLRPFWI